MSKLKPTPNPKLIFKINYELLSFMFLLYNQRIYQTFKKYIEVNKNRNNRIEINNDVKELLFSNSHFTFRKYNNAEDIKYRKFHYFILKLSDKKVLYTELVFFGIIKCYFIIGKFNHNEIDDIIFQHLNKIYFFPIEGNDLLLWDIYPNIEKKDIQINTQLMINLIYHNFQRDA